MRTPAMADFQQLITSYHAFYEVLPYHVVIEEGHGSPSVSRRVIQAGFDVDVHGVSNDAGLELPPPGDYALAYTELKKIAQSLSHASDCSIEVIPFPSTVFSDARKQLQSQAILRIRISHHQGAVAQRAGAVEQHALEELEKQLQSMGIRRQ
jgi:hypothetical protein